MIRRMEAGKLRPKKRILLIDKDEHRLSITRFQLKIWGYEMAQDWKPVDLILAFTPADEETARKTAEFLGCPSLLVRDSPIIGPSQCTTTLNEPDPWFLLDHIKHLCARKRGPLPKGERVAREVFRAYTYTDVRATLQAVGCPGD